MNKRKCYCRTGSPWEVTLCSAGTFSNVQWCFWSSQLAWVALTSTVWGQDSIIGTKMSKALHDTVFLEVIFYRVHVKQMATGALGACECLCDVTGATTEQGMTSGLCSNTVFVLYNKSKVHTYYPSTLEAWEGGLWVQGRPGLHSAILWQRKLSRQQQWVKVLETKSSLDPCDSRREAKPTGCLSVLWPPHNPWHVLAHIHTVNNCFKRFKTPINKKYIKRDTHKHTHTHRIPKSMASIEMIKLEWVKSNV